MSKRNSQIGLESLNIECWNARGWNYLSYNATLQNYPSIDILGITEMHSTNNNDDLSGNLLRTQGDPNDPAAGVGLLLSNRAKDALIFTNVISPRIIMARFKASRADLTVICVYIPHQGRAGRQKPIYEDLNKIIATVSIHDCLVVLGDFNSRLGRSDKKDNFKDKEHVGRWSIHHRDCPGGILLRKLLLRHIYAQYQLELCSNLERNETTPSE